LALLPFWLGMLRVPASKWRSSYIILYPRWIIITTYLIGRFIS
jgi:hypothetical protein